MKTFFEFMKEDLDADLASFQKRKQSEPPRPDAFANADSATSNLNRNLIRKDPPITPKREPVDTTGANSPFADPSVKSYTPVTSDKPMIGKNDAVAKALAAKGYTRTGEKVNSGSSRPFPDQPNTNTMQDKLNMKRLGADQWHSNFKKKMDEPRPSTPSVKVGSLAVKQTGYPAAEKPKVPVPTAKPKDLIPKSKVPVPTAKPKDLVPKQNFDQAFSAARKAGKKEFNFNGKAYNTKLK